MCKMKEPIRMNHTCARVPSLQCLQTRTLIVFLSFIIISTIPDPGSKTIFVHSAAVSEADNSESINEPINFFYLPGVSEDSYRNVGDINIGALALALSDTDTLAESCSKKGEGLSYTADSTESIAFAVELVNKMPNLLPNVSLGFVIRGTCSSANVALATSLSFLPRSERVCSSSSSKNHGNVSDSSLYNGTYNNNGDGISSNAKTCASAKAMTSSTTSSEWLNDDVIGLISPDRDYLTTMISSLFSVARLPIVGTAEVGDELSDKDNHPYFFRISPPSQYQIKAILKFLSSNGWSYISIIYGEGPYGQAAYEGMVRNAANYGICIATSHMLISKSNYDDIVADLLKYPRARAVVLFMLGSQLRKVLRGVKNNNATGHFIFVAGDLVVTYSGYLYYGRSDDPAIGMFVFDLYSAYVYVLEFYEFLRKQKVASSTNPWLRYSFEYILECSYDTNQTKIRICHPNSNIFQTYRYRTNVATSLRIDAVLTLAHAAHNLLQDKCPGVVGKAARLCITGPLLREYLKNVSYEGYTGHIEFNSNQDVLGKYSIGQYVYDYHDYPFTTFRRFKHMVRRPIGEYDAFTDQITYYQDKPITWSHVNSLERIVPWKNSSTQSPSSASSTDSSPTFSIPTPPSPDIPESVCSGPCGVGEYRIQKDVPCCWECRRCRENERLVQGNTSCEACPSYTWPDPDFGLTTCEKIPPTYPAFTDEIPLTLTTVASLCLIIAVIVFIIYIVYRDHRVIKASSKELSVIQLVAILAGYVTVILYQTTPTDLMCSAIFFMFCMSFALLYCPLLVKTIRIFRIFQSGAKNEKPRFISPESQLVLSINLIAVQATICAGVYIFYRPQSKLTQPIWTEKYVELSCDLTFFGMGCFLAYNIVQVFLCSVFAFKVRQLPDNFNESKFISMCVSTTLLIWLAFIPTYFTADREYIRTFLLSTALIMNHSVALILLFIPKIYAAMFLDKGAGNFSNNRS